MVEKPWENCSEGGISPISPPGGAGCWGMASPDVRHTKQGSLAHAGHMGSRIPEAQVKVLFHGPAVILVGHWIRVGRALPQTKGWFDTKPLKLHGWAPPHLACMFMGTSGHCRTKPNLGRPSGGEEPLGKLL